MGSVVTTFFRLLNLAVVVGVLALPWIFLASGNLGLFLVTGLVFPASIIIAVQLAYYSWRERRFLLPTFPPSFTWAGKTRRLSRR
jgi:hypothetical protein